MDPGDTYYAFNWNFTRLYARPLTTFKPAAGKAGLELVPDLAEALGEVSADGLTWTYKLKQGITYDDGTPVTSKDVKYAIARSNYTDELINGPKYFQQYLDAGDYAGPYKDKNLDDFTGIETPDDPTIVFKLKAPFSEFDFLVSNPQSAPVPQAKDKGLQYQAAVASTGPYKMESHEVGKSLVLVKNDKWDPATDKNRKQLADRIEVQFKVDANDIDQRLLNGQADVDLGGTGVQAQARATLLQDEQAEGERRQPADRLPALRDALDARSRPSTTPTAARPFSTPPTTRPSRPPRAVRSVATSRRPRCRRARSATRRPTSTASSRTRTATRQGQGGP